MNTFKLLIMAAIIGIFSKTAFSQEQKSRDYLKKAIKAYEHSLDFKLPAVVESAIYNVIVMKKYYPNNDYDEVLDQITDLAADGETATVRYKAQLAALYFEYPALFENIQFEKTTENPEMYFKMISDKLVNDQLALN